MEKDEEGLGTDLDAATDSTDTDTPDCDGRTNRPESSSDRAGGDDMDQDTHKHTYTLRPTHHTPRPTLHTTHTHTPHTQML